MSLSAKKQERYEYAKQVLDKKDVMYRELANGQLQVDGINLWTTKESWYDPATGSKGTGMNSFIGYLKSKGII